jgi:iron complex outermembrane recepter protein
MSHRKTLIAASIFAGLCMSGALYAQDQTQNTTQAPAATGVGAITQSEQDTAQTHGASAANAKQLSTVTVTGIRASLQASLDTKRNADAIIDAITAEDIGMFPATNVAEALAQVPGVTLDRSIPGTQRVSIDGMDPSLNVTLLDGHPVSQALWLFGDSPNRGFNYSLLPPEILGQLEIIKSPEASTVEGSLGGTVLMHTVQPLDVPSNTLSGSFGSNYNDMVGNQRPNGSVFYSWHNSDKTFGVDVSAQHYEQFTSREGLENYGYTTVSALNTEALAAGNNAIQNELNAGTIKGSDWVPNELSGANFQQIEKRNSVLTNIQYRPNQNFESTLSLMYMKDGMDNVNESLYPFMSNSPAGITSLTQGPNGVIVAGTQVGTPCVNSPTGCTSTAHTFLDNYARQSMISTKGADLKAKYSGDGWRLAGDVGISTSSNPMTSFLKEIFYGGGYSWNTTNGAQFTNPSTADNPNYWADDGWGGNEETELYKAKDTYGQLDFSKDLDGFFNELEVGVRYASHWESQELMEYEGPQLLTLNQIGYGGLTNLEGAQALGLSQSMVSHVQTLGLNAIKNAVLSTPGFGSATYPLTYFDNTWAIQQQNEAAYVQADFGNDDVHGNIGARYVYTQLSSSGYYIPSTCSTENTYDSGCTWVTQKASFNNWLPAFNIAWNITPDLILRGALNETVAYAPYNELAPYFESNDSVLTAAAGNPNLKPYRSANFDASLEWYFNDESVLAVSAFYKDVLNYVVNAATVQLHQNGSWDTPGYMEAYGNEQIAQGLCTTSGLCAYDVTAPVNGGRAKVEGGTVSYQQAFGHSGFGVRANFTYSNGSTASGGWLPYNSKDSYNLAPYFEKGPYSASISYNWRSRYLAGGYVAGAPDAYTDSFKELDASAAYKFNQHFSVSLDMLNLLNTTYYQYLGSRAQLYDEYVTGRQYMLEAHFKF